MTSECPVCHAESTDGLLCHADTTRLERDLGDVAAIVDELNTTLSRQARIGQGGKGGGLASEKTPIHLGALEVADNLGNVLTTWARDLMEGDKARWLPSFVPSLDTRITASRVLLSNVDLIRKHPAVEELVDEIADAIGQARRVVDRPADRMFVGPCLVEMEGVTCHEDLYAKTEASWVVCRVCGSSHDIAERRDWLLREASDRLFTVREAAQMLGTVGGIKVTEASIRGYLHRERIAYRPGGKLIRLGDLLAVVMDEGERRSA